MSGGAQGLVIQALTQTAGRGRHGRIWESGTGNIALSLLLRPLCSPEIIGQLAIMTGLAVARVVRGCVRHPEDVILKWPNDVLLGGRKCAGILLETELDAQAQIAWVAVGVGLNVASAPEGLGAAVQDFAASPLAREEIVKQFLETLGGLYETWQAEGFARIKNEWLALTVPVGTEVSVKTQQGGFHGAFMDLDTYGNLIVRGGDGMLKTISAGEVFYHATGH